MDNRLSCFVCCDWMGDCWGDSFTLDRYSVTRRFVKMELGIGFIIGVGIVAIRIIWCHFDAKKMNKELLK